MEVMDQELLDRALEARDLGLELVPRDQELVLVLLVMEQILAVQRLEAMGQVSVVQVLEVRSQALEVLKVGMEMAWGLEAIQVMETQEAVVWESVAV